MINLGFLRAINIIIVQVIQRFVRENSDIRSVINKIFKGVQCQTIMEVLSKDEAIVFVCSLSSNNKVSSITKLQKLMRNTTLKA